MTKKIEKTSHLANGTSIEQRVLDGFINATAMCVANQKELNDWFRLDSTYQLFCVMSDSIGNNSYMAYSRDSGISRLSASKYGEVFTGLLFLRRGSPKNGGGVWLHPDLAIQLPQWCNAAFALQVSKWVREWMTTGQNPIWSQEDLDRVGFRANLKDEARIRMTDQVKIYLEQIKRYDNQKYRGIFFARVHDAINIAITGEKAKQMRERLSKILGKKVSENELIRDYFPSLYLQRYIALCESAANYMLKDNLEPLTAVEKAIEYSLPANYIAKPIDFVEHIKFVRGRVASAQINLSLSE